MERIEMPKVSESNGYRIIISKAGHYLARENRNETRVIF